MATENHAIVDKSDASLISNTKLNYGKTFLIGTGFFASSLLWSLYNSFVPLILSGFLESTMFVGMIMTIDNIFGVIFQPFFGALSDRTTSRFGRRMPYIMIGAPLCALLFLLIPQMPNLPLLMAVVILFNFGMSVWRAPIVALMPDLTAPAHWSQANGVINLMGGLASIIAFLIGGKVANLFGRPASFLMGTVVMLLAVSLLFLFVKERQTASAVSKDSAAKHGGTSDKAKSDSSPGLKAFALLPAQQRRKLLLLLMAIFFWFFAYNAVETFFTSFAVNSLGQTEGSAAMLLAFFSVSFVVFAIPSGFIAAKLGRRKTIIFGLIGLSLVFIPLNFVLNILAIRILLLIGGFCWALVNINSLPMVLSIGKAEEIGTYTGYYYFFSFAAAIGSPILFGLVRDLTGSYASLFVYAPIFFCLALICIVLLKQNRDEKKD